LQAVRKIQFNWLNVMLHLLSSLSVTTRTLQMQFTYATYR